MSVFSCNARFQKRVGEQLPALPDTEKRKRVEEDFYFIGRLYVIEVQTPKELRATPRHCLSVTSFLTYYHKKSISACLRMCNCLVACVGLDAL